MSYLHLKEKYTPADIILAGQDFVARTERRRDLTLECFVVFLGGARAAIYRLEQDRMYTNAVDKVRTMIFNKKRKIEVNYLEKVTSDFMFLNILSCLEESDELAVNEIVKKLVAYPQPYVSCKLRILRRAGLVTLRRQGKTHYYSVNRKEYEKLRANEHLEKLPDSRGTYQVDRRRSELPETM